MNDNRLQIINDKFQLNGEKFNIYGGAIHYFRTVPECWEDRLMKLKLAGFNTVETYVCWNLHEKKENEFDFTGMLDLRKFVKLAEKVGLYAIVRPGPYICAEWDFGGLPAWLLKDKNIQIRTCDVKYMEKVSRYMKKVFEEISDLQFSNGGNIIAMQIENEYGHYGSDKVYLQQLSDLMTDCGLTELAFTSDSPVEKTMTGGTLDDTYKTVNFGSNVHGNFKNIESYNLTKPYMCMEFWCGWFDHFGGKHNKRKPESVAACVKEFLDSDANFNFYMFHGGTNFGFTSGANYEFKYKPTTTSYDYGALLTENGDYTKAYHLVRELLHAKQGLEMQPLLPSPKVQNVGKVNLTTVTSLFDNLDNIGEKHHSIMPNNMEDYGQNSGLIYYKAKVTHGIKKEAIGVENLADYGYMYINDKFVKKMNGRRNSMLKFFTGFHGKIVKGDGKPFDFSLLVDTMGRVNFGFHLCDRKGITRAIVMQQSIMNFDVHTLPFDNIEKVDYSENCGRFPLIMKGEFTARANEDCYLHLKGFTKGFVFVNGFNLGRYWKIGPQRSLYIPNAIVKEKNEIVVVELEKYKNAVVEITDKPDLG